MKFLPLHDAWLSGNFRQNNNKLRSFAKILTGNIILNGHSIQFPKLSVQNIFDMIKPETYPSSYPALHKIDRMKESLRKYDIEDLHEKILSKLPLYVTFEDKLTNHVGVPQPKCTACGNCVGGCNVGSKNTLNMNYLPNTKAHGAEIFTEVKDTFLIFSKCWTRHCN